ncbi:MAG: T9SS type A sorting domain-containing protein [Ignavibacteria bacterium]|nr:T9SS type A sorting domain-containing protein [Ignavibacteria bacterium]MBT8380790.1 T9SS type A sorting domain-containing protein [Ignavibacteria bacterium]
MVLTIQLFGQLETIKEFPRAYDSQEIWDLTPVWISGNEILVFYKNSTRDTIFSRRTTNLGQTWSEQKLEFVGDGINAFYYRINCYNISNGRLLFFWNSNNELYCTYSDDEGASWIDTIHIEYSQLRDFSLLELEEGKIILFLSRLRWQTRPSTDNGETWSILDYYNMPFIGFGFQKRNPHILKLSENGDSLLAIFSSFAGVIYSLFSADSGNSWSDTTRIIDPRLTFSLFYYNIPSTKTVFDRNKNIWLLYDARYDVENEDYSQADVSVLRSTDNGTSWQRMDNFTSYLGDDYLSGVTSDGENIFVCFNTSRSESFNQVYYGILGESEDTFTPPVIINSETVGVDYETEEVNYRAKVIDEEGVKKVFAKLDQINFSVELFDDGLHNDSLANDNIYGNTLPIANNGKEGDAYAMDLNNITLPFNSSGVIADVNIGYKGFQFELEMTDLSDNIGSQLTRADFPIRGGGGSVAKFDERGFLYSSGFFLSGFSNGQMWSNAVASASIVEDYVPGKVGSDIRDPLNVIYVVNKRDPAFSYAWQNWKDAVSLGAEFYDGDGDGVFNPVDKNWNGTWDLNEDMPPLIGNEIAWCVYNDGLPANQRRWQSEPQGIEVRQTIFATDSPELENVIFIRYSILNTGLVADVLDSIYFGIYEDGDLGDATDDVVGCDTLLQSGYYYNNEPDAVYGDNCPAFSSTLLQGPVITTNNTVDTARNNFGQQIGSEVIPNSKNLSTTSHNFFIGGDPDLRDPNTAIEGRNFLKGGNRLGQYPNPCTFAYGQVRGGINCNEVDSKYWFSGDPVTDVGWICTQNQDKRNLVSTGPFELEKNKPQEIIIAYVIGRGADPINSITVARENVRRAIAEYESNFATMTYIQPPPTNPVTSYVLYQNYPNPFNPTTTIRYELPQDGIVTIDIYDILGQKVQTILNEFKRADRYEVTFNSTGLASGVYIYRMKVNDFITSKKMVLLK